MEKTPEKNPNLNSIPFIDPKDLKKAECLTCKGQGIVKGKKCDVCGGSGFKDKINILQDYILMEKGKPQKKYEITIRDVKEDKVLYKNTGYGGVLATVEKIKAFSGKIVGGNYQSAMWGNPLIQRFAIDRLEEKFAEHIEEYIDAMEQTGLFFNNREELKRILIEGNIRKLQKIMGMGKISETEQIKNYASYNPEEANQLSENNRVHILNKINEIINKQSSYAFLLVDRYNGQITIDTIIKGLGPKDIIKASLESAISLYSKKRNTAFTHAEKAKLIFTLLKEIAEDTSKEYKTNN